MAKNKEEIVVQDGPVTEVIVDKGPKKGKIKLFKDNKDYKDDVFVSVNGERFLIKRGIEVEVPDYVIEVLRNSAAQDEKTAMLIEAEEAKYNNDSK